MKLLILPLGLLAMSATEPETAEPDARAVARPGAPLLGANPDCPDNPSIEYAGTSTVAPQRLGDLAQAHMELAVDYREDGCTVPVVVMENVER